jgi:hypothetical protein
LRWAGHVIRGENKEIIKIIVLIKPGEKRKKGRTSMRWMDGVEKNLRNFGVINWKTKAHKSPLEEVFRAGRDQQMVVVPIIIHLVVDLRPQKKN